MKKRIIIPIIIAIILLSGLGVFTFLQLSDKDKLTVEEKEWLTQNQTVVQSVHVVNNVDVFGKNGEGVFFDFIKSVEEEYTLDINEITYNSGEAVDGNGFKILYEPTKNSVVFHEEHYVVISKEKQSFSSLSQLANKKIGILTSDQQLVTKFTEHVNGLTLNTYESQTNLLQALEANNDIQYAIVPLEENLTSILTSNYNIVYHISDMKKYFVYEKTENDIFSSIVEKHYLKWNKDNLSESINENQLNTFVTALSISDKDITDIQAKTYSYGFVNTHPYEVLLSGTYGGIVSEYLSRFAEFSKTEFTFTKYKNVSKFTEAIANNTNAIAINTAAISESAALIGNNTEAITNNTNSIEEIQGKITGGSINIDGASAVRRTCSLTMVAPDVDITNTYWALKNKFKLEVGVENTIDSSYPDICWFK
jgi:hypothetical protein